METQTTTVPTYWISWLRKIIRNNFQFMRKATSCRKLISFYVYPDSTILFPRVILSRLCSSQWRLQIDCLFFLKSMNSSVRTSMERLAKQTTVPMKKQSQTSNQNQISWKIWLSAVHCASKQVSHKIKFSYRHRNQSSFSRQHMCHNISISISARFKILLANMRTLCVTRGRKC